jgi:hypothetical protein
MTQRDERGRFIRGNQIARAGGRARAERLTPERRREIARAGWEGFVNQRFGGDADAARRWFAELGGWVAENIHGELFGRFEHPGPCPEKRHQNDGEQGF